MDKPLNKDKEFIESIKLMLNLAPDWIKGKRASFIFGRETLVEYNPADGILKITKKRCTNCGQCCMSLAPNSTVDIHWGTDDEGKCLKLKKEGKRWVCTAGMDAPLRCFPDVTLNFPECEMEYYIEEFHI